MSGWANWTPGAPWGDSNAQLRQLVDGNPNGVIAKRECDHDWRYDEAESAGPWTGYIERCAKCGALQQIPQ